MKTAGGCQWNIVNTDSCQIRGYLNSKRKSFQRCKKNNLFPPLWTVLIIDSQIQY